VKARASLGTLAALALLLFHAASFPVATQAIVSDVRYYLYFAWRVAQGALPHRDYFDHKNQLAALVGALFLRLGETLGLDPLLAIRLGYLGLAVLLGWLLYAVQRRLAGGSSVAGLCGVAAYCSFGLLFLLPAIGNVPKLILALAAPAAALCVQTRRYLLAGLCGALAFLDWQIGILVWLSALAAALLCARPRRGPVLRLVLGGALGVLPYGLWLALGGALPEAWQQLVGGSLARSAGTQARDTLALRLGRMRELVELDVPGAAWLAYASLGGLLVLGYWLRRRPAERPLLACLGLFQLGVLGFSLLDFQFHADLFLLLQGAAFLQGLLWSALLAVLNARGLPARFSGALVLAAALLVARPGFLRPELVLAIPGTDPAATLQDQRAVAELVRARCQGKSLVLLEYSELLFLLPQKNPLPAVFWNNASWQHYRATPEEGKDETLGRLLSRLAPEAFGYGRPLGPELVGARYSVERFASRNGRYVVYLQLR
jgi:hypothetical protein